MSDPTPTLTEMQSDLLRKAMEATDSSHTFHVQSILQNRYDVREYNLIYNRLRAHPLIEWVGNGNFKVRESNTLYVHLWFWAPRVTNWVQARNRLRSAKKSASNQFALLAEATEAKNKISVTHLEIANSAETTRQQYACSLHELHLALKAVDTASKAYADCAKMLLDAEEQLREISSSNATPDA